MQMVLVFVEENNLAVFDDQLLVNGCKYPDVPNLKWCAKMDAYISCIANIFT
jgi:hypothetical protein